MQETMKAVLSEGRGSFKASGAVARGVAMRPHATIEGSWIVCAAGEAVKGISEHAAADGEIISVCLIGGTEALAGAAIPTPGTWLKATTNGKLIPVTTNLDPTVGYSLGIATALNDMVAVIVFPYLHSA